MAHLAADEAGRFWSSLIQSRREEWVAVASPERPGRPRQVGRLVRAGLSARDRWLVAADEGAGGLVADTGPEAVADLLAQIAAEPLMAVDALVVVDGIAAAV
jgi:hypothetical protein